MGVIARGDYYGHDRRHGQRHVAAGGIRPGRCPQGERQPVIGSDGQRATGTGQRFGADLGPFLEDLVATFNQALVQLEQDLQQEGSGELAFNSLAVPQVAALLATGNAVIALLSLILGRYWQAALYNPGGFGDEVRALKLPGRHIVVDGARLASLECGRGTAAHHRRVCISACLCSPREQRGRMVDPDVHAVGRARSSEVGMGGMCRDRRIC